MTGPKSSINLLTAEIRPQGQWDRIYAWTANTAKYIIIITEMIVIGAIGFRFVIDGRIAKLDEQIEMDKQLLDYLAPEESKIRQLLTSMQSIQQMEQSRYSLASYYQQVESLIPPSVTVQSINIDIANSSISGQVTSYDTLLQLENNLKNATEILSNATMSTNQAQGGSINFSATFNLKLGEE
jgi:Tfp pilus assembly protein PilN